MKSRRLGGLKELFVAKVGMQVNLLIDSRNNLSEVVQSPEHTALRKDVIAANLDSR